MWVLLLAACTALGPEPAHPDEPAEPSDPTWDTFSVPDDEVPPAEDEPHAQAHHPHAVALGAPGHALPQRAERRLETLAARGPLGQHLVAAHAVVADGGGADEHGRLRLDQI